MLAASHRRNLAGGDKERPRTGYAGAGLLAAHHARSIRGAARFSRKAVGPHLPPCRLESRFAPTNWPSATSSCLSFAGLALSCWASRSMASAAIWRLRRPQAALPAALRFRAQGRCCASRAPSAYQLAEQLGDGRQHRERRHRPRDGSALRRRSAERRRDRPWSTSAFLPPGRPSRLRGCPVQEKTSAGRATPELQQSLR